MKRLLIIILCFWAIGARSQGKVSTLKVYEEDGKTVIGKILVNAGIPTKLLLLKSVQKKDTSDNYSTTFYLGNKETTPLLDARILMKFNKAVIAVKPEFSAAFNSMNGLADDRMTYSFKAGRLDRDPGSVVIISFTVKSKEKVITEISGLDGIAQ